MAKKTLTQQTADLDVHQSLGDRPNINDGLSATQLKVKYDEAVNSNKTYLNSTLITELQESTTDDSGAQAIGFDNLSYGDNVADALDTIISAGTGSIPPDGTITNAKLATDVKVGSLASLTTTETGSVVGAINELDATSKVGTKDVDETDISDGRILKYDSGDDDLTYIDNPVLNLLSTTTVSPAAASVNIPITGTPYKHLRISFLIGGSPSANTRMTVNNITTSTYESRNSNASSNPAPTAYADLGSPDANEPIFVDIYQESGFYFTGHATGTETSFNTHVVFGETTLTTAITSLQFFLSSGNIPDGTQILVYGYK